MTVQVTPLSSDSPGLAVVTKDLKGVDVIELYRGTGNYAFDWEVKCVRRDYENYKVIRPHIETTVPKEVVVPKVRAPLTTSTDAKTQHRK